MFVQYTELEMNPEEKKRFKKIVRQRMKERGIPTLEKLAELMDINYSSMDNFFYYHKANSKFLAAKISNYLDIPEHAWRKSLNEGIMNLISNIGLGIVLCLLGTLVTINVVRAQGEPERKEIDFEKYIVEKDVEEEVFGVDYGNTLNYEPAYVMEEHEELHIEATAYCYGTTTCTGKAVREGIAAMAKEYIGMTAIVYEDMDGKPGDLIGIYEIEDTGGDSRIKEGKCIDIYIPSYDEAIQFGRRNVIVFLVNAKG